MPTLTDTDPKQFLNEFFAAFLADLLTTDDDAATVVDRYHTPDIVQFADGHRMDRDKLIEHTRPVRRTRPESRLEVHEALTDGDLLSARYTMRVRTRRKRLSIEICFFGRFTPDGRMRSAHMLTRTVASEPGGDGEESVTEPAP